MMCGSHSPVPGRMPTMPSRAPRRTTALLWIALLAACGPSPTPVDTGVSAPERFARTGAEPPSARWWTDFGATALDSLVDSALESNLDVRTARERIREADAVLGIESARRLPSLDATATGELREGEGFVFGEEMSLGLRSSYELDLFGAVDASVEADRFRAAAVRADLRAVEHVVAAEVASTWCRVVEARSQVDLLRRQEETNVAVLELLGARFGSGRIRSVDVLRQRQLVESTRERIHEAEGRLRTSEHALAVLLGRPAGSAMATGTVELPALPPLPATGVPAALVERRPDVRRAWFDVQAADRDLATAIRERYPRIDLTASITTTASEPSGLFEDWIARLAGDLLAPIFRGGALRAEVERTDAVRAQRLFDYVQAVLEAFREVEDALVLEQKQSERIRSLDRQIELAVQSYEQLRSQYLNGLGGYLDVLTALTETQELRRARLAVQRARLETRIALYRALAGPIHDPRVPDAQEGQSR